MRVLGFSGILTPAFAVVAALDGCESPGNQLLQASATARKPEKYRWQSGRGNYPNFGVSSDAGPFRLNETLAWTWHHPKGRFHTFAWGVAVDHKMNLYLGAADGLRKLDSNGTVLWEHHVITNQTRAVNLMNAPSIYQGAVYASDTDGGVRAVDMDTGKLLWYRNLSDRTGQDNGFTMVHEGVVFTAHEHREPSPSGPANHKISALDASSGKVLWSYEPDTPVWNFLPLFPDKETVVFQDMTGKLYHMTLHGKVLWKAGGKPGTWTDGSAALGNKMVFSVHNNHDQMETAKLGDAQHAPGTLSAYDLHGKLVWKVTTPRPPNNAPAVGKVKGWDGLTVIMPLCQQVMQGATCDVYAFNADTGALRWVFNGPTQKGPYQAGDLEGSLTRMISGVRPLCLPNGWSAPTISADGTVFVGEEGGNLYALRDTDGDGRVQGPEEVSFYDTKAAFSGSSSPAVVDGMVAAASCDSLFVFKSKSK